MVVSSAQQGEAQPELNFSRGKFRALHYLDRLGVARTPEAVEAIDAAFPIPMSNERTNAAFIPMLQKLLRTTTRRGATELLGFGTNLTIYTFPVRLTLLQDIPTSSNHHIPGSILSDRTFYIIDVVTPREEDPHTLVFEGMNDGAGMACSEVDFLRWQQVDLAIHGIPMINRRKLNGDILKAELIDDPEIEVYTGVEIVQPYGNTDNT
jgi:hypothetical protein